MMGPAIVAVVLGADCARLGEVDGGISAATAPRAWAAGAELLVAGSAILAHPESKPAAVAELRRCLQQDGTQRNPRGR